MSNNPMQNGHEIGISGAGIYDMKLEIVIIPVADVERAKRFYGGMGWRLDIDFKGDNYRVIQFTPP